MGSNPRATLHQSEKSTIKLNISYFAYLTCVPPVPTGFENCIFSELTIFIRYSSKLILTHLTGGNFITLWSILEIDHKLSKLYRGGNWGVIGKYQNTVSKYRYYCTFMISHAYLKFYPSRVFGYLKHIQVYATAINLSHCKKT